MPETAVVSTPLAVRDAGQGPAILLLHGLGGDSSVWEAQVPELAREFRVLAPDLRGHGRTSRPEGSTFSFPELEADLERLVHDKGVPSPVHVVGLSAGGFLALRWAVDAPSQVRSLTLINSSVHCDNHTKAVSRRWAETYRDEGFEAYVLRLVKDLYYPDWIEAHPEALERLRTQQQSADLSSALAWADAVRGFDLRGRLTKFRCPTRVLQSMDDGVIDGSHGRLLRVSIPGADLRLFSRAGHLLPIERPIETTEAIREFVRSVEGTAAAST